MRRIVNILHLSRLLPLSGFAEEVETVEVRRSMEHPKVEPVVSVSLPQLAYYPDGSLKYDDYGEIVNIEYNAVKFPSKVDRGIRVVPAGMAVAPQMEAVQSVLYGYSADGVKLRREERTVNAELTFYSPGHFTTDTSGNSYKWGGKEWDKSLYRYDFGARLYDPSDLKIIIR